MYTQNTMTLPEKDLVFQMLAETKRVAGEYCVAVTEASCPVVRQMFTSLLNDTLQIQGEIFQVMQQHGWYQTPKSATRQDIANHIQTHQQDQQQTQQFVSQRMSGMMTNQNFGTTQPQQSYGGSQPQSGYRM